jgi:predicted nucleic acid-binding protein
VSFLLDTNVVSELRKGARADAGVAAWFAAAASDELYLSVLVIGEIRRGIERVRRRDAAAAASLERWLTRLGSDHEDRILPVDRAVAEAWGRLDAAGSLPTVDGLLAATAEVHGLTLVTRNTRDFARTGVPCLDPFAAARRPGSRVLGR